MNITYECEHCDHVNDVTFTPGTPAQLSGPPESCYPAEPSEIEPEECEECGAEIPFDEIADRAEEQIRDNYREPNES